MFCPNFKNKEVFKDFNDIVTAFGGKPMTEDEFKSSELRNQRTGQDLEAATIAYKLWHLNNGYGLNKAPNGNESKLFKDLVKLLGSELEAIKTKSKIYTTTFRELNGDWLENKDLIGESHGSINISSILNEDGSVNFENLEKITDEYFKNADEKLFKKGRKTLRTRKEHHVGESNTLEHLQNVYKSATQLNLSDDIKPIVLLAAALHDLAKPFHGGLKHGFLSVDVINLIFDDSVSPLVKFAVRHHMLTLEEENKFSQEDANRIVKDAVKNNLDPQEAIYVLLSVNVADIMMGMNDDDIDQYSGKTKKQTVSEEMTFKKELFKKALSDTDNLDLSKRFDENGEPSSDILVSKSKPNVSSFAIKIISLLSTSLESDVLSKENIDTLSSGKPISSKDILNNMINSGMYYGATGIIAEVFSKHDIPVVTGNTLNDVLAATVTDKYGGSVIVINRNALNKVSKAYAAEAILHEIVHAITVKALNDPITEEEKLFAENSHKAFTLLNKIFDPVKYDRTSYYQGWYALNNEKEFAAVFMSNEHVREAFYDAARVADRKTSNKIKRVLSRLINSFTNLIVHKKFFDENTSIQTLDLYKQSLYNYVLNKPAIVKGDILTKSDLHKIYLSINDNTSNYDMELFTSKALNAELEALDTNPIMLNVNTDVSSYKDIIRKLNTKLLAIRNSKLTADQKAAEEVSTKTQVQLLHSDNVAKYIAVTSMLGTIGPRIHELRTQLQKNGVKDENHLRYLLHSEFGVYDSILKDLSHILSLNMGYQAKDMIDEYNRLTDSNSKISMTDIERLSDRISLLSSVCSNVVEKLQEILKWYVVQELHKQGTSANSSTIESYINSVFNTVSEVRPADISSLTYLFGAADAVNDEAVRCLTHIVKKANDAAENATIDKALAILKALNKLKKKSHIRRLYEVNKRGITTGYLVRDRNFGMFYEDLDEFLKVLNEKISKKYNIPLDATNRQAPDQKDARKEWLMAKNEWLDLHCDQQYTKEYYDAWSSISQETRELMRDINNQIYSLTHQVGVWDESTNTCDFSKLSDPDWEALQQLFTRKKLMRSFYTENGQKKEKDSPEYNIAKELNDLYDKLYPKKHIKYNREKWEAARNQVIERCGGLLEYNKWKKGKENNFQPDELLKWDERNSKLEFRKLEGYEDEQAIIFQQIDNEMHGLKPYYGEEYDQIGQEINDKLKPFKKLNGEIDANRLSEALKSDIKKLIKRRSEIRNKALENNETLLGLAKKYGEIFSKYIEFVDTELFKLIKQQIRDNYVSIDPLIAELIIAMSFGDYWMNPLIGIIQWSRPYRWYQTMRAKDIDKYMVLNPGDGWIDRSESDQYTNKDYDESYNTKFVPKKVLKSQSQDGVLSGLGIHIDTSDSRKYDNQNAYNLAREYDELSDYYDLIHNTIVESNKMQTNRPVVDNFLLPQATGSVWKRMRNKLWCGHDGKFSVIWKYIQEFFGKKEEDDYTLFGQEDNNNQVDETGLEITSNIFADTYKHSMPDGSTYRAIPQFFTRKLKDPSRLSSDLSGIVIGYYNMSKKFEEKSKINDKCELILEQLKNTTFTESSQSGILASLKDKAMSVVGKQQGDSNIYKMGRSFLDANLYDIKMEEYRDVGGYNLAKMASNFKMWTTATNLGLNPKVAVTGFLTTAWTHMINALTGQKYDKKIATLSAIETLKQIGKSLFGATTINNCLTNNKQVLLMEMCNVSDLFSKKYKNTNRNRLIETINRNCIFGMMSTFDYIMKAQIMTSVMMSFRMVDGKFMTKDDIRGLRYQNGINWKQKEKELLNKWKEGKCLYNCLSAVDNKIVCDPEYNNAFEQIKDVIKNRSQKYSEHADGMATELQKAAITRSIFGAFILIHRQYLPLMLQERFGDTVYDYDIQQMKGGLFRTLIRFGFNLMKSSKRNSFIIGTALSAGILGVNLPTALILGGASTIWSNHYAKKDKKSGKHQSSVKEIFKNEFKNYSTEEDTLRSLLNQYNVKQIAYEIILFRTVVSTLASMICYYADDNKKNKLLLAIAFWMRGLLWEAFTPYRVNDIVNNFKSPSAALGQTDSITAFLNGGNMGLFDVPLWALESLCAPPLNWGLNKLGFNVNVDLYKLFGEDYKEDIISRGTYKGMHQSTKKFMKMTPLKNIYEQSTDSYSKRRYFENLIMDINKKDKENSYLYQLYLNYLK